MVEFIDYYTILGIADNASFAEIKAKYRQLAKVYHPDRNKSNVDAKSKMQSINEAYSILSNNATKVAYDEERIKYYGKSSTDNKSNTQPDQFKTEKNPESVSFKYTNDELNDWILKARKNAEKNKVSQSPLVEYLSIFGFLVAIILIVIANIYRIGEQFGVLCFVLLLFTCARFFVAINNIFSRTFKNQTPIWLLMTLLSVCPSLFLFYKLSVLENNSSSGPIIGLSIFFTLPCAFFTIIHSVK